MHRQTLLLRYRGPGLALWVPHPLCALTLGVGDPLVGPLTLGDAGKSCCHLPFVLAPMIRLWWPSTSGTCTRTLKFSYIKTYKIIVNDHDY